MRHRRGLAALVLWGTLCLLFCGCAGKVEETQDPAPSASREEEASYSPFPAPEDGDGVALAAMFRTEEGTALSGTALLSSGQASARYALDEAGQVRVSGIPREGLLGVRLLDESQKELGATTVSFSAGEVIDASADQDGAGYVTLREDTLRLSLVFVADGQGHLWCALLLDP